MGDIVLSRSELGGQESPTEYKRVTKAFCSGEDKIIRICCQKASDYDDPRAFVYFEFMTPNYPLWCEQKNDWITASQIQDGTLLSSIDNDDNLRVLSINRVYKEIKNDQRNIGCCYSISCEQNQGHEIQMCIEFSKNGYYILNQNIFYTNTEFSIHQSLSKQVGHQVLNEAGDNIYNTLVNEHIKVPVYNIEVEDFNVYFVGENSIWVHNTLM